MTTTTERIANAIKGILEEDRRADRERIAELERDAAHFASVEKTLENWQEIIDDLNRQLDEAHAENARLVLENVRLVDSLAMGNPYGPGMVAPVVEEQGPWVVYDFAAPSGECYGGKCGVGGAPYWKHSVNDCRPYEDKQAAEDAMALSTYAKTSRVMTLAEARAIEAKRG